MNANLDSTAPAVSGVRHVTIEPRLFNEKFEREPVGFTHDLSGLELFQEASLAGLVALYEAHRPDYFVSASAAQAGTDFFSVRHSFSGPVQAYRRLHEEPARILLKRPENHDRRFRDLLDSLFGQLLELRPELRRERLVRLESSVFITSAASTTPFHFDPEIACFFQIEGEKTYHVYPPEALSEADLEHFYLQGQVNIGQVNLAACDPALERVFHLRPGIGFHQPQNSPHWVETRGTRSISYSFVFETDASRGRGRARACNYYLRKAGLAPLAPGHRPAVDAVKSGTMRMLIPVRQRVSATLKTLRK